MGIYIYIYIWYETYIVDGNIYIYGMKPGRWPKNDTYGVKLIGRSKKVSNGTKSERINPNV